MEHINENIIGPFNKHIYPKITDQQFYVETFKEFRTEFNNILNPYSANIQQKLSDITKEYNISNYELIILVVIAYFIVCKILKCFRKKEVRDYRQVTDRTMGFFPSLWYNCKSKTFQFLYKNVGFLRNHVKKEIKKTKEQFLKDFSKDFTNQTFALPKKSMKPEKLQDRIIKAYSHDEEITNNNKTSGQRYCLQNDEEEMKDFVKNFIFHNPLHAAEFPGSRQMEAEVIKMTCALYNLQGDYGITTTGGSESIMLGILAARNYFGQKKKITKPNIIIPTSAHAAHYKAAFYYDMEPIIVPLDKNNQVIISEVEKAINKNTVCIVGSNPNFQSGMQDDIPALGKLAIKYNIGLHVDSCLGSFVIPYAKDLGAKNLKDFDFKVPGVTSISCDHHKYGCAPKGVSVVMFKNNEIRQAAYFSYSEWPGGLYATAQHLGSRSTAPIAGAWYAMMSHGQKGYRQNAEIIINAVNYLKKEINSIPQLEVLGNPEVCAIGFTFNKTLKASIYQLDDELKPKGWTLSACQKPESLHISITLRFAESVKDFVKDLKEAVKKIKQNPKLHAKSKSGTVGVYGASGQIPDNALKADVLREMIDVFTRLRPETGLNKTPKKNKKPQNQ
ncbi:Pyridoxal phosphate-dependent transferase [Pseudocohnilembus persalinus]|uniref:sphinganine-1-phosphate aldolase n=1 Tax=Pseudocohnilembus persalinus TaxID=266149 RepID=A0A0V0QJJ3_PSEPJ|nr:Pyridoxal phosphate-dependent transferase [Pseudocohnilembus persalinus]|eukprot:KRX02515.1 Pyridoxal phosphate-dependent transferase [Pseudocohnilembus persalinus]